MIFAASSFIEKLPVLIPFAGYLIAVFAIAIVAHRYLKGAEFETEYYVGGRSFGAWVLAMSWVATMASGGSFLGYPSLVYSYGWSTALWVSGSAVTAIVGLGIVGKRINRLARQTGALTLVDLLRDRFQSQMIGTVYPLVIISVITVYLLAQFVAGARILEGVLEISYETGLLIFAVSVIAYTVYGGFRAVAWTDTLQGIVMIVGIVLLVPFALYAAGGLKNATKALSERVDPAAQAKEIQQDPHAYLYGPGPQKIDSYVSKKIKYEKTKEGKPPSPAKKPGPKPWLPIGVGISMFMTRSLATIMMPTTVPRMLAFKDTKALRKALMILAPYLLLMYGSSLISMNCAHAINLGLEPYESDMAVPTLAALVAPKWLAGVIIAAPFAAVMSTVDSALLVVSASVVRDLVQKSWYPSISLKSTKLLSYAVTGGMGILVFFLAFSQPTFLQPLVIYYSAGSASALCWPGIAMLFWKRATAPGILAGLIGGATVFVLANLFQPFYSIFPLHPFAYGFTASAMLTYGVSLLTPRQDSYQIARYFGKE